MEKKDIRIQNLEQQIRAVERKHKDDLKQKQKLIDSLQSELSEKSDQIAQMQLAPLTGRAVAQVCTNSHTVNEFSAGINPRLKNTDSLFNSKHLVDQFLDMNLLPVNVKSDIASAPTMPRSCGTPERRCLSRESSGSSYHSGEFAERSGLVDHHVPMPPSGRPPSGGKGARSSMSRHRRHVVSAQQGSADSMYFGTVNARPASAKKMADNSPVDTEEILQIAREQRVHLKVSSANSDSGNRASSGHVIPPIKPISGIRHLHTTAATSAFPSTSQRVPSKKNKSGSGADAGSNLAVEILAVDQVISPDQSRQPQRFDTYTDS